jgi:hypothetical protein
MITTTEFNNKRSELGIEGTGIDSTVKQEIKMKDGVIIPVGARVHIDFAPKSLQPYFVYVTYGDYVYKTNIERNHHKYTGFTKQPTDKTLQKRSFDGISKSITGKKVEPDGYGPDGAPSWELVLGYI